MKSKLHSFTILEIVVTIAVTAILVTLVYGAINFLNAQNYREMRSKDRINEWMIIRKQMIQDVYLSNTIEKIDNGMKLIYRAHTIRYVSRNEQLVIEKGEKLIETPFKDVSCSWSVTADDKDKCTWTVSVMGEQMKLYFYAFSSRADRINQWFNEKS